MCGKETLFIQRRFTMCGKETLFIQRRFTMCGKETLFKSLWEQGLFLMKGYLQMIERGLYYTNADFQKMIQSVGGEWNDTKHRPIVCLIKSSEDSQLYWAIPMGKLNHRDKKQQARLNQYLSYPDKDIRSCYYHIGRTSSKSIFFISDAVPVTDKYIDGIHVGGDNQHYIIKNKNLLSELERKLYRILSVENTKRNSFRQHITDVKNYLLKELKEQRDKMKQEAKNLYDNKVDEINKIANEQIAEREHRIEEFETAIAKLRVEIDELNLKRDQDLTSVLNEYNTEVQKIDNV